MSSKIIQVGGKFYRPTTRSFAVAMAASGDPMVDLRKSLVDALGESAADELLGKVSVRPRTGKSIRAARAAGDGGICPFFGLDYETSEGVHHPADCGKEHDGKFAKAGDAAKGTGYAGHWAWASKGAPVTTAAHAKAKKAAAH